MVVIQLATICDGCSRDLATIKYILFGYCWQEVLADCSSVVLPDLCVTAGKGNFKNIFWYFAE